MQLPDALVAQYAQSLKKGDILLWRGFEFENGHRKTKRVLVVSDCIAGKAFVVVLPTSKTDHYIHNDRAMVDTVCFVAGQESCFEKDTVIDLKHVRPVAVEELVPHLHTKTVEKISCLSATGLAQIDEAVKNAETLTPKIQSYILGPTGEA